MLRLQSGHQVDLLEAGAQFFPALIAAIDGSQSAVHLETYIFHFEAAGGAVAQALERAALRGVDVKVVVDGIGTDPLPIAWEQRWMQAGVQWHRFAPLGYLGWFWPKHWRRLHRKLCVVDAQVLFCGGINMLDDHVDPERGVLALPRFDFAVQVRGPLVLLARETMLQFWNRLQVRQDLMRARIKPSQISHMARVLLARNGRSGHDHGGGSLPVKGISATLVLRDNLRNRRSIEHTYRQAIAGARSEIIIANAYFLPGAKLRRALVLAVRRGVRVRLLLQGQYEYFMQYHGARLIIQSLLDAGIEIVEYQNGFLHAKVAVIDARWVTVGSSNLDPLSLLLAREANIVLESATVANDLRCRLEEAMATHGVLLSAKPVLHRPLHHRIMDRVAHGLVRLLLWLSGKRY